MQYIQIGKWLAIITALTTLTTWIYNAGYESAKTEIQSEYNKKIQEQRHAHDEELKLKLEKYNRSLIDSNIKRDNYWRNLLDKEKNDLIAKHTTDLEAARINNATTTIVQDSINNDALLLLQQSKRIIRAPTSNQAD